MKNFSIPLRLVGSICLIGFLCLQCQAVLADEALDIPPPLFETRYFKEGDPAVTTSKCIGNPVTPLCAVDTWRAASAYSNDELRRISRGEIPGMTKFINSPPYNPNLFCYQIIGSWIYQNEDRIYETQSFLRPGDVAFVVRWGVGERRSMGEGENSLGNNQTPGKCDLNLTEYPFYRAPLKILD